MTPIRWQKWLTGDVYAPKGWPLWKKIKWRRFRTKLARAARRSGRKWHIASGPRTYREQKVLYLKYLDGTGNLAAKPGTSNHEIPTRLSSAAADVYDSRDGRAVGSADKTRCRNALSRFGLGLYVGGEPWHVESHRPGQAWRA